MIARGQEIVLLLNRKRECEGLMQGQQLRCPIGKGPEHDRGAGAAGGHRDGCDGIVDSQRLDSSRLRQADQTEYFGPMISLAVQPSILSKQDRDKRSFMASRPYRTMAKGR